MTFVGGVGSLEGGSGILISVTGAGSLLVYTAVGAVKLFIVCRRRGAGGSFVISTGSFFTTGRLGKEGRGFGLTFGRIG